MTSTTSRHRLLPLTTTLHILLVRHAESYNNVIADQLRKKYGVSPYTHGATAEIVREYDLTRMSDPVLSPLGYQQAKLLPEHQHWSEIELYEAMRMNRVAVYTSPLIRTILTSIPLLQRLNSCVENDVPLENGSKIGTTSNSKASRLVDSIVVDGKRVTIPVPFQVGKEMPFRAQLNGDLCERGGFYRSTEGENHEVISERLKGSGRDELNRRFGNTHDASGIPQDGWWNLDQVGEEKDDEFRNRIHRVIHWLKSIAFEHAQRVIAKQQTQDHLVIVCHADFIDSMLTQMLQVANNGIPKHVFYAANTSVSHLELTYLNPKEAQKIGYNQLMHASDDHLGEPGSTFITRLRCSNSQPVAVESHTPDADVSDLELEK
jgi:broad specificity phosphatase PhoE